MKSYEKVSTNTVFSIARNMVDQSEKQQKIQRIEELEKTMEEITLKAGKCVRRNKLELGAREEVIL